MTRPVQEFRSSAHRYSSQQPQYCPSLCQIDTVYYRISTMTEPTAGPTTQEDAGEGVEEGGVPEVRKKHLSNSQRNQILQSLLSHSSTGKLDHGAVSSVAKQYNVTRETVGGIWKRGLQSVVHGSGAMVVEHRRSNCGRKKKDYTQDLQNKATIPVNNRSTIRSTAHHMGLSTWAVWRMNKKEITRHSKTSQNCAL